MKPKLLYLFKSRLIKLEQRINETQVSYHRERERLQYSELVAGVCLAVILFFLVFLNFLNLNP